MENISVGIDKATFYSPHYFLDLKTLAATRGLEQNYYEKNLGQRKMAVCPPDEGVVSMAANAAQNLLSDDDIKQTTMLLFATETGIDQSKAAGIYVHKLVGLNSNCRVLELKQACYSATAGLQFAINHIKCHPNEKVLIIASDIARYGLNTSGESSQGGGAIAMLISKNPRLLKINDSSGVHTEDAMDFWRPNYKTEALVDGRTSCQLYLKLLKNTWQSYSAQSKLAYADHDHFCYHTPVPSLVEKAHRKLANVNKSEKTTEQLTQEQANPLEYCREIGNCYSASLYIGLVSLLENSTADLSDQTIGCYSYGSGAIGEFFSMQVMPGYKEVLFTEQHKLQLANRVELTQQQYENFYNFRLPTDGSTYNSQPHNTGKFRLSGINNHQRIYECTEEAG